MQTIPFSPRPLAACLLAGCFTVVTVLIGPVAKAACLAPAVGPSSAASGIPMVVQDSKGRDRQLYSRSIALLVGESSYPGGKGRLSPLSSIPKELANLRQVLESQGFEVWTYFDLDSSKLERTIECFMREKLAVEDDTRFLFWFAGHGTTLRGKGIEGFLLPVDGPSLPPDTLDSPEVRKKGLPLVRFRDWAEKLVRAKHAMFVFDSCFSGAILNSGRSPTRSRDEKLKPAFYVLSTEAQKPLREFVSSGSEDQEVPASSIFVHNFTRALRGERREADINNDGLLTGTELVTFLKESVSEENSRQTPTSGRSTPLFNRGEMAFALPVITAVTQVQGAMPQQPQSGLRPVFRGAVKSGNDIGKSVVEFYEADNYLTTDKTEGANSTQQYTLTLDMPPDAPAASLLDTPELRCLAGSCLQGAKILAAPSLSTDRRTATVTISAWGEPTTWRLAARVLTAEPGQGAVVVDRRTGAAVEVDSKAITIAGPAPALDDRTQTQMTTVLAELQVDDNRVRRAARKKLAKLIETGTPDTAAQLIRQITVGTYRYKLGLATALADARDGWLTGESSSRNRLEQLMRKSGTDPTLRKALAAALDNQRLYAYYELDEKGGMTAYGQLHRINEEEGALSPFDKVAARDVLKAKTAVNLRSGVGRASGIVTVAAPGQCVAVVRPEPASVGTGKAGGWLQVRRLKKCQSV